MTSAPLDADIPNGDAEGMTLEAIRSDLIDSPHGFFTRRGGASSGVYEGLNAGPGSKDQREVVALNRARVADHLGAAPGDLRGVHQVHSADVVTVAAPLPDPKPKADALVTNQPGHVLTILLLLTSPRFFLEFSRPPLGRRRYSRNLVACQIAGIVCIVLDLPPDDGRPCSTPKDPVDPAGFVSQQAEITLDLAAGIA